LPGIWSTVSDNNDWIRKIIENECPVLDPCTKKFQCTTLIGGCAINPARGYHVGSIENPPKHYRVSFDFKCSEESTTNVPKTSETNWLNILELSTLAPGNEWKSGVDLAYVSFYTNRDYPLKISLYGEYSDTKDISFCKDDQWDGYIIEKRSESDDMSSILIIRKSDNMVYSRKQINTETIVAPENLNAYLSSSFDYAGINVQIKNLIFERL